MNKALYRLIFDKRLGMLVPVAENRQAHGKQAGLGKKPKTLVLVIAAMAVSSALANPTAPTVVSGTASFNQIGNALTVTNSPNAIINWGSFSIGRSELTQFVQQNSASAVLNRVTGQDPSQILGQLQSNGRVFLINPNGVVFGAESRVDTAGLIASSLNLGNADFLAGRLKFSGNGTEGSVKNTGAISTSSGGQVLLIAPDVENSGVITSPNGEIILAAGHTVELTNTLNPALRVQVTAPDGRAINLGTVIAEGGHIGMYGAALQQAGTLNASSVVRDGGRIYLKATQSASLETGSQISANSHVGQGGQVEIEADALYSQGSVAANGTSLGGTIKFVAQKVLQSGEMTARASVGDGGQISLNADHLIQTEAALLDASGAQQGGRIQAVVSNGVDGRLLTSATYLANGGQGGEIKLLGHEVVLLGAHASAGGIHGGGSVLVGGGARGVDADTPNSANTYVNFSSTLEANATQSGNGGNVVVWSNEKTAFYGKVSARGGDVEGAGGSLEVSGKAAFLFGGRADASAPNGAAGSLLLDPRNIIIDDSAAGAAYFTINLVDPDINAGDRFGDITQVLANGNILVREPSNDGNKGAVHLYNGTTGALISSLFGEVAGSYVGSGNITSLSNGNFLMESPYWRTQSDADIGAVTWSSATAGVNGLLSDANSLVGTGTDDFSGSSITQLGNGNFLVFTPNWNQTNDGPLGALTWGSGTTGIHGAISSTISLVGSSGGDFDGSSVVELANHNYVVSTPGWENTSKPATEAGAVTWGSGTTGAQGAISASISLVGSHDNDNVGNGGITLLGNSHYVVRSGDWSSQRGAVTWGSGATGVNGEVSSTNSLVGTTDGDGVGSNEITLLPNGNYVVNSWAWDDVLPAVVDVGAVTWVNGNSGETSNASNVISDANSLIGSTSNDRVGYGGGAGIGGVIPLYGSSNYLVRSPKWNNGLASAAGALTWGDGDTGVAGVVSWENSLVGSHTNDQVGGVWGITELSNGNYVALNPDWDGGKGAVTWGDGYAGVAGVVDGSNSLLGSIPGDKIGLGGLFEVGNANYVVHSPNWNNTSGAVTWVDGSTGLMVGDAIGAIAASNSLVGAATGDEIGSDGITVLSNGNYVVSSPLWDNGLITDAGAVTWGDGFSGTGGIVSATNSMVGQQDNDHVGLTLNYLQGGVVELANSNYLIISPEWDKDGITDTGAVTWVKGSNGQSSSGFGAISAANSLVGSSGDDRIGSGYAVLANGNYVIMSPDWDNTAFNANDAGAVTWGNGNTGVSGPISSLNSVVGTHADDRIGGVSSASLANDNYLIINPNWNADTGAVIWIDGVNGTKGAVSSSNALVGKDAGDQIGSGGVIGLFDNNLVIQSPNWANGLAPQAGAVTYMPSASGRTGVVSAVNSIVGTQAMDQVGSGGVVELFNGNYLIYLILSPLWDNDGVDDAGAVTWNDGNVFGAVSTTNSLVGSSNFDWIGWPGYVDVLTNGNYVVRSPDWDDGLNTDAGAVTWGDGTTGTVGVVSAANSLIGSHTGDRIGNGSLVELSYFNYDQSNYVISSTDWDGGKGAITWASGTTATVGTVSSNNSLVGSSAGDFSGYEGILQLTDGANTYTGNYLVRTTSWDNGAAANAGSVTWGNGTSGVSGVISAANSLVGSNTNDQVGQGITLLAYGHYAVSSPIWDNGATVNVGAVTWGDGSTGIRGEVSSINSLIGDTAEDRMGSGGVTDLFDGNFLVASPLYDNTAVDTGLVQIYIPGIAPVPFNNPLQFGDSAGADSTLHPDQITALLNAGTAVELQANNDITVNSAIIANYGPGDGDVGDLTMTAGRSIHIHADIFTDNGNLTLTANETVANGVVDDDRLGDLAASIEIDNAAVIDVGSGAASLTLRYSDDKTYNDAALIRLGSDATLSGKFIHLIAEDGDINVQDAATRVIGHTSVVLTADLGNIDLWNGARVISPDITATAAASYNSRRDGPAGVLEAINGSIALMAHSVRVTLAPGASGLVDITATGGDGISVTQEASNLYLSHYTFSGLDGSRIELTAPLDLLIDDAINRPALDISLYALGGNVVVTGDHDISAASLYVRAGEFVFDNVTSFINAPATLETTVTVLNGGQLDLDDATQMTSVRLEGTDVALNEAMLNVNHRNSTFTDWVNVGTGGVLNLPAGLSNLGPGFRLQGGMLNNPGTVIIDNNYVWTSGSVSGAGSLTLNAGRKLSKISVGDVDIQQVFNNNGTVDVQAGELHLSHGGTHTSDFNIASAATLLLGDTHNFMGQIDWTGAGQVVLDGTGTMNIENGASTATVNVNSDVTFDVQAGGNIVGDTLINQGTFNVGADTVSSNFINYGTANLADTTLTKGFTNLGYLSLTGAVTATAHSRITDGTVDLNAGGTLVMDSGGLLSWSGGTFGGTGTLDFSNGAFDFAGEGDRILDNPNLSFVFSNLDFPAGSLTLRAGSLTFDSGTLAANRTLTLAGGTLTNNTDLTVAGTFNLFDGNYAGAGDLNSTPTGFINLPADSTVLWTNTGDLTNAGMLMLSNTTFAGALTNASTGSMNLGPNLILTQTVDNQGALELVAGTTAFQSGLTQTAGSTRLNGGDIEGDVTLMGGTFGGNGTVTGDVVINNTVTLSPGGSPGTINIVGNLTLNPLSTTLIELGGTAQGTDYDFLNVTGIATLDGELNVALWGGYFPALDTLYTPLIANAVVDSFASEMLPSIAYSVIYNPSSFDINFNQAFAGLPPPVVQQIVSFENLLGLIGIQTPQTVLAGEGAAPDLLTVGMENLASLLDAQSNSNQTGMNGLFNDLMNQADLQGWNDESRLVCR